ncbi:MAG: CBS domain-containing protein [Desulfobacteraceae bacterium]|nr:CBS domain-containing protein [Desulfobacteraceae bacterium]
MVSLSKYATVTEDASLYDAVLALKKAQKEFNNSKYPHRAVIILDKDNQAVGKVSQLDVLKALEPKYQEMQDRSGLAKYGFSRKFMQSLLTHHHLWDGPLDDVCLKGAAIPVSTFMETPSDGEFIEADANLDEAIHQMVLGYHQSLLVMKNGAITGILRLTDVFDAFSKIIEQCEMDESE